MVELIEEMLEVLELVELDKGACKFYISRFSQILDPPPLNTGRFKKNGAVFILQISQQPSIGFSNRFFLLKTEIHM